MYWTGSALAELNRIVETGNNGSYEVKIRFHKNDIEDQRRRLGRRAVTLSDVKVYFGIADYA